MQLQDKTLSELVIEFGLTYHPDLRIREVVATAQILTLMRRVERNLNRLRAMVESKMQP